MHDYVDRILEGARKRILTLQIRTAQALTDFIEEECGCNASVDSREVLDAAIGRGLFRYIGGCYQNALNTKIADAREAIVHGIVRNDAELVEYLKSAAPTTASWMPVEKVFNDLKIDARQAGLYRLIREVDCPTPKQPQVGIVEAEFF
jgi:hypothetical protein